MHAPVDYAYVGCFHEDNQAPDLTGELPTVITNAEACLAHCSRGGWSYAAVHNQNICTCGDSFLNYGAAPTEACSLECSEQHISLTDCEGPKASRVYKVNSIQTMILPTPLPSPSTTLHHSRGRRELPEESQAHDPGHSMPTASPTNLPNHANHGNMQGFLTATHDHAASAAMIGCIVAGAGIVVAAIVLYVVRYRRGSRCGAKYGQSWIQNNDLEDMYKRWPTSSGSHIFAGFEWSANNCVSKPAFDHTPVHPFDCSESPALLSVTTMPPIDAAYPGLSDLQSQRPVATPRRRRSVMTIEETLQSEIDSDDDTPDNNLDPRSLSPVRRNLHQLHSASDPKLP